MDLVTIIIIVFGVIFIVGGPIVADHVSKASYKDAIDTVQKTKNKKP